MRNNKFGNYDNFGSLMTNNNNQQRNNNFQILQNPDLFTINNNSNKNINNNFGNNFNNFSNKNNFVNNNNFNNFNSGAQYNTNNSYTFTNNMSNSEQSKYFDNIVNGLNLSAKDFVPKFKTKSKDDLTQPGYEDNRY